MKTKLTSAPVRWTMGQPLLPEHFEAQEQALRDEFLVHLGHLGLPRQGLARLRWDVAQLSAGVVRIQDLTLVLPSGRLIDIPGNCPPLSFDLESVGDPIVPLRIARFDEGDTATQNRPSGAIERRVETARLIGKTTGAPGAELFPLGEFTKDVEGAWTVDARYIPPCLSVRETPFFVNIVDRLHGWLERFHEALRTELRENFLAGHLVLSAQQAMRSVFQLRGWLADLTQDLDPHPYELFDAVRRFYIDVCIYRELKPAAADTPYDHLALAECFGQLASAVEPLLVRGAGQGGQASYVGFTHEDGMLVARLPREIGRSRQVFVLVQKSAADRPIDLMRHKLASPTRLALVHQRSLRGIRIFRVDSPPFHHDFSSDVAFFGLELEDEWDHAVGERALALYDRPALKGLRFFVYWR